MTKARPLDDLKQSIKALAAKSPHILGLRFPNYRNLKMDAELRFEFPITILLGQNGTNKSSILHALYGSPAGKSISEFWFETVIDAIPAERNGRKQSVVHWYKDDHGNIIHCIKARAPRPVSDPDYWEAVKHSRNYGFDDSGVRVPGIQLEVMHLDFRAELPAFDKYFYFPDPSHLKGLIKSSKARQKLRRTLKSSKTRQELRRTYRKQDYLRQRSKTLKKAIEKNGVELSSDELVILRYILDRDYQTGIIYKHSLFHGHEGSTVLFRTDQFDGYSDAFAGSGESAATILVHKIHNAPDNSLILLDEPETSLHPRAQKGS